MRDTKMQREARAAFKEMMRVKLVREMMVAIFWSKDIS